MYNFDSVRTKDSLLAATLRMISYEEKDVFTFYIPEQNIREHITKYLESVEGYKVINSNSTKHIYVYLG